MERSKYGQVTYKAEADRAFPEGCACGNNGVGDCDWCGIYYDGPLYDDRSTHAEPDEGSPWLDEYDYYDFPEDDGEGLFDPEEEQ